MNSEVGKPVQTQGLGSEPEDDEPEIDPDDLTIVVVDDEDDSDDNDLKNKNDQLKDFDCNLAMFMDDGELDEIANSLSEDVDNDEEARGEWTKHYKQSLVYLGLTSEDKSIPWPGCANVVHPMILEAIVRFGSRALGKLFPAQGPASITLSGVKLTPQIQTALNDSTRKLNEHLTLTMKELMPESDAMNQGYAQIGSGFGKVEFSDYIGRTAVKYVKAEDFLLPYDANNLETASRYVEYVRRTFNEVQNLIDDGYYRDLPLDEGLEDILDHEVEQKKGKLEGQVPTIVSKDGIRFREVYSDLRIDIDPLKRKGNRKAPYLVTIDDQNRVFCIRRNWRKIDKRYLKRTNFVRFTYVPGEGSYGRGMVQLIGQLAETATKILRQLIDSGTLANLPAVLKSQAAGMDSQDPVAPGEFRDVECSPEDLKNAFFPLPFKEPSAMLFQLLELVIAEAKTFSSTADLDISASSQNAPVGTTLALLERQTEVSNAVQIRMHTSFGEWLRLIVEFIKEYETPLYEKIFNPLIEAIGDSDGSIIVTASGDPTSSTMSQRILQLQSIAQNAAQAPQVYDQAALHRAIITTMGLPDADLLVPDKSNIPPMSIVEEHMALMTGKPIKAFQFQNQQAHLTAHMALLTDKMYTAMLQNNPAGQQMAAQLQSHISEHMAFDYMNQMEKQIGTQLPPLGQPLPPQIASQLDEVMAKGATQIAQVHAQQAQQMAAQKQSADPAFQLEQQELQIKAKAESDKAGIAQQKVDIERERLEFTKAKALADNDLKARQILATATAAIDDREADQMSEQANTDLQHGQLASDLTHRLLDHGEHLNDIQQKQQEQQQTAQQAEADRQHQQQLAHQQAQQAQNAPS